MTDGQQCKVCSASFSSNTNTEANYYTGTLSWGQNQKKGSSSDAINEDVVIGYQVRGVRSSDGVSASPHGFVFKRKIGGSEVCCDPSKYTVPVQDFCTLLYDAAMVCTITEDQITGLGGSATDNDEIINYLLNTQGKDAWYNGCVKVDFPRSSGSGGGRSGTNSGVNSASDARKRDVGFASSTVGIFTMMTMHIW